MSDVSNALIEAALDDPLYPVMVIKTVQSGYRDVEPFLSKVPPVWRRIVENVAAAPAALRMDALDAAIAGLANRDHIREAILAADPTLNLEALLEPPPAIFVPALPEDARPDASIASEAGAYVEQYCQYAVCVSPMTPVLFHESAALWLGSAVSGRRVHIRMPFANVFPNLMVIWSARTTLFRKTTAMRVASDIAREAIPMLLAPHDSTPESMIGDMAGQEPTNFDDMSAKDRQAWEARRAFSAQRGILYDEVSGLLASAQRDYNSGSLELLLRWFDCDPEFTRSTRSQGLVTIRNSFLTMLGCSTPDGLAPFLHSSRLHGMGFWPRVGLMTPQVTRPDWAEPVNQPRPTALVGRLVELHQRLPTPVWPNPVTSREIAMDEEARKGWSRYNKALSYDLLTEDLDDQLFGVYGRLPTQVLKLTAILALLDWEQGPAPRARLPHLSRSIQIAETWRASFHRALAMPGGKRQLADTLEQRIRNQLTGSPTGLTLRDLSRQMKLVPAEQIEQSLQAMLQAGDIQRLSCGPGERGGRPTMRYRLAR